jgi:hypothetical protein
LLPAHDAVRTRGYDPKYLLGFTIGLGQHVVMKRDSRKPKPMNKLTLAKESVRRLSEPELFQIAGRDATAHCATITLKCCLTR